MLIQCVGSLALYLRLLTISLGSFTPYLKSNLVSRYGLRPDRIRQIAYQILAAYASNSVSNSDKPVITGLHPASFIGL